MIIDVGLDFSKNLINHSNRYINDDKHTAISFRNKYLKDLDKSDAWNNDNVFIKFDFSKVIIINPSFANEAFSYFNKYSSYDRIINKIQFINISNVKRAIIEYEIKEGYYRMLSTEKIPTLEDAIQLACKAHQGAVDKVGEPYILHPLRVMLSLTTLNEKIVGVLHDTVEDTYINFNMLYRLGYSETIIQAIDSITRRKNEDWMEFIKRTSKNNLSIKVKKADINDNINPIRLSKLDNKTRNRLIIKYNKALSYYNTIK